MGNQLRDAINGIIRVLRRDQATNGSWNYPFETGIATDCYMIILLRTLEIDEENLIKELTKRILSKQEENGSWKLFYDEPKGNLSATIEAYYALLYSGYFPDEDLRLKKAQTFIIINGGMEKSHLFTKIMLMLTDQLNWPVFFPIPLEILLLPNSFPVNFYDISVFGRANLVPVMLLGNQKFQIKTNKSPNLSNLLLRKDVDLFQDEWREWRSLTSLFQNGVKHLIGLPQKLHHHAKMSAKQYMLNRIESDGTFYSYFSSTFLMIFALLSLGYSKKDPVIINAVKGLISMKCEIKGLEHMQYTTANVWNTALINTALQKAGVSPIDPCVMNANDYLLSRQHMKYGDWKINNPTGEPGGWGFSNANSINPDVDDTTASLRSIARRVKTDKGYQNTWKRGVKWVLSMQNNDGGWPAFEKGVDNPIWQLLPISDSKYLISDPSSADLTGRTLEFLGSYTDLSNKNSIIKNGVKWLFKNQEKNGSWYGRWGICYIYGTWAALTGLGAVGISQDNYNIQNAVRWLEEIQNPDGGWGESCLSDGSRRYIPLQASTLTDTAWATDALIAVSEKPTKSIQKGIEYLINNYQRNDWTTVYPKGQGMADAFYIHYHSYRYIFPLYTLTNYVNKYMI